MNRHRTLAARWQQINCTRWNRDSLTWFIYWMQNLPELDNTLTYQDKPLSNWRTFSDDFDLAIDIDLGLMDRF